MMPIVIARLLEGLSLHIGAFPEEGCYRDGPYDAVCTVEYALVEVALRNANMRKKKVACWGKKQRTYSTAITLNRDGSEQ